MNLVRWDPFSEVEEMTERLNHLFVRPIAARPHNGGEEPLTMPDWTPAVDIAETPEEYLVKVELPEIRKEDVKVGVANGVLYIEGERKAEKDEKSKKFHRIERHYGAFMRTFSVPDNVDAGKVVANMSEGVLMVHLPKLECPRCETIEIAVS